ncbi:dendritic arbor reduction protein 1-like [Copidosoma floridanum]|uniref:dendritic arbor reduction protein 1-like n=1 Tax=Copidosoma floridanum TaxID=29053 RepID=UPI0006C964D2|nr:dendritic arbor reduction protein 1-like [Copidosoma floridanum]
MLQHHSQYLGLYAHPQLQQHQPGHAYASSYAQETPNLWSPTTLDIILSQQQHGNAAVTDQLYPRPEYRPQQQPAALLDYLNAQRFQYEKATASAEQPTSTLFKTQAESDFGTGAGHLPARWSSSVSSTTSSVTSTDSLQQARTAYNQQVQNAHGLGSYYPPISPAPVALPFHKYSTSQILGYPAQVPYCYPVMAMHYPAGRLTAGTLEAASASQRMTTAEQLEAQCMQRYYRLSDVAAGAAGRQVVPIADYRGSQVGPIGLQDYAQPDQPYTRLLSQVASGNYGGLDRTSQQQQQPAAEETTQQQSPPEVARGGGRSYKSGAPPPYQQVVGTGDSEYNVRATF